MGFFLPKCRVCSQPIVGVSLLSEAGAPGCWAARARALDRRGERITGWYDGYGRIALNLRSAKAGTGMNVYDAVGDTAEFWDVRHVECGGPDRYLVGSDEFELWDDIFKYDLKSMIPTPALGRVLTVTNCLKNMALKWQSDRMYDNSYDFIRDERKVKTLLYTIGFDANELLAQLESWDSGMSFWAWFAGKYLNKDEFEKVFRPRCREIVEWVKLHGFHHEEPPDSINEGAKFWSSSEGEDFEGRLYVEQKGDECILHQLNRCGEFFRIATFDDLDKAFFAMAELHYGDVPNRPASKPIDLFWQFIDTCKEVL